jgi:hypothetical protein
MRPRYMRENGEEAEEKRCAHGRCLYTILDMLLALLQRHVGALVRISRAGVGNKEVVATPPYWMYVPSSEFKVL